MDQQAEVDVIVEVFNGGDEVKDWFTQHKEEFVKRVRKSLADHSTVYREVHFEKIVMEGSDVFFHITGGRIDEGVAEDYVEEDLSEFFTDRLHADLGKTKVWATAALEFDRKEEEEVG
eukprot:TRINITY_DN13611_c0_g1_i2.p1 TRINITY_DN13611_c0_g1~~TRINITY_DN13611_c0_g1_i2.p1  ORF type:complete len:118 (+),score=18.83 TRINITY_DN13611_c0_g1_i2:63-416(+)